MSRTAIETHGGLVFDYLDPSSKQVCVEDVAHALSNICRFGGHIDPFYSVAQHSLLVRMLVIAAGHSELGLAALHHDSHEAYTMDVPKPLKNAMGEMFTDAYHLVSERVNDAVAEYLGLRPDIFCHPVIKQADDMALRMEATTLKINNGRSFAEVCGVEPLAPVPGACEPMSAQRAKGAFLLAHRWENR